MIPDGFLFFWPGLGSRTAVLAPKPPGSANDLLLQLSEFGGLILALLSGLTGLRLAVHVLAFPEYFLEGTDFSKEQVTGRTAGAAIRTDIVGPEEPGNQLVGLEMQVFQTQSVLESLFLFRGRAVSDLEIFDFLSRNRVPEPIRLQAEIVPNCPFKSYLLERRWPNIAAWRSQAKLGQSVGENIEDKLGGHFVCASFSIDKLEVIHLAPFERELLDGRKGSVRIGFQTNEGGLLFAGNENGGEYGLIKLQGKVKRRAFHRAEAFGIFNSLSRERRVCGIY
jgi:hypothetical protein